MNFTAYAAILFLAPVAGPLAAGFAWNWRRGRDLAAGMCACGLSGFCLAAPTLLAWLPHRFV